MPYQSRRFTGTPLECEIRLRRGDGEYCWFLDRIVPFRDDSGNVLKWIATVTDIHALKRSEQALPQQEQTLRQSEAYLAEAQRLSRTGSAEEKIREQEAELRQILDLAPQQVRVYGPGGERLYANRIALDYYSVSFEYLRSLSKWALESIPSCVLVDGDSPEQSLFVEQGSGGKEQLVLSTVHTRVSAEGYRPESVDGDILVVIEGWSAETSCLG